MWNWESPSPALSQVLLIRDEWELASSVKGSPHFAPSNNYSKLLVWHHKSQSKSTTTPVKLRFHILPSPQTRKQWEILYFSRTLSLFFNGQRKDSMRKERRKRTTLLSRILPRIDNPTVSSNQYLLPYLHVIIIVRVVVLPRRVRCGRLQWWEYGNHTVSIDRRLTFLRCPIVIVVVVISSISLSLGVFPCQRDEIQSLDCRKGRDLISPQSTQYPSFASSLAFSHSIILFPFLPPIS